MYIYIHIYIYIYVCVCVCVYIYVFIYMYLYIYIYVYTYVYIRIYIYVDRVMRAFPQQMVWRWLVELLPAAAVLTGRLTARPSYLLVLVFVAHASACDIDDPAVELCGARMCMCTTFICYIMFSTHHLFFCACGLRPHTIWPASAPLAAASQLSRKHWR